MTEKSQSETSLSSSSTLGSTRNLKDSFLHRKLGDSSSSTRGSIHDFKDVSTAATVGPGRMGVGIAIALLLAGVRVYMLDAKERDPTEQEILWERVTAELREGVNSLAELGLLLKEDVEGALSRVSFHPNEQLEEIIGCREVGFVVESVPEIITAKETVLSRIGRSAHDGAIITSATSTFLTDDLARYLEHPEHFLNAHWLNPAFLIPLVELSPGSATDPAVTTATREFLQSIGKVPVVCAPSPGFIVPRIQALAMNEAARIVEEGIATAEDVDMACRVGFGIRFAVLGLLEFIDWGGCDVLYHASNYLQRALSAGERYAPPAIVEEHVNAGHSGGRGHGLFYRFEEHERVEYQREKLTAYVALLRHLDLLPHTSVG